MTSIPYSDNPTSYRGSSSMTMNKPIWDDDSSHRSENDDDDDIVNDDMDRHSNISGSLGIIVEENDRDMRYVISSSMIQTDNNGLNDVPLDGSSIREECARYYNDNNNNSNNIYNDNIHGVGSLPHVEEMKMNKRGSYSKNRRLKKVFRNNMLSIAILFLIVILLAIVIPLTTKGNHKSSSSKNTSNNGTTTSNPNTNSGNGDGLTFSSNNNPKHHHRNSTKEGIFQFLQDSNIYIDINTIVTQVHTPQHRAVTWLAQEDEANLVVPNIHTDDNTTQYKYLVRYIMVVNFYAFNGPDHWGNTLNFLTKGNVCTWKGSVIYNAAFHEAGIFCDAVHSGIPTKLQIFNNQLMGTIPTENGYLTSLHVFDVSYNQITGTIPTNLCQLTKLQELDVSYNQIKGGIPPCIGTTLASSLTWLYVNNNTLSGSIPTHLAALTKLERLIVEYNQFTGDPTNIVTNMIALQMLNMGHNNFNGTIGSNFVAGHKPLQILDLSHNQFTLNASTARTFPHHLLTLKSLKYLDLSNNPFYGTFPKTLIPKKTLNRQLQFLSVHDTKMFNKLPDFHQLVALKHLDLSTNSFEGTIPQYFGSNMTNLELLYLSENPKMDHNGDTIPDNFAHLTKLRDLSLRSINIGGTIPSFIGHNLTNLVMLDLGMNNLNGTIPTTFTQMKHLQYLLLNGNLQLSGGVRPLTQRLQNNHNPLHILLIDGTKIKLESIICPSKFDISSQKNISTLKVYVDCTDTKKPPCSCCSCCVIGDGLGCSKPLLGTVEESWKDTFNRTTYVFFEDGEHS